MFLPSLILLAVAHLGSSQQLYNAQQPLNPYDHSQGYQFDPLLHLPGISPYFDAVAFGLGHNAPSGCNVTAASYIIRHSAIYANDEEYETYIKPFLKKLEKNKDDWSGPLEFMKHWQSPILEDHLEDITPSGAEDAVRVGLHLLERYRDLVPTTKRILADKKARTYDTAKNFIKAFPNASEIELVRITKDKDGAMDALIPHKSCAAFNKEPGKNETAEFISNYAPFVSNRLRPYTAFNLTDNDVVGLQQLCGYESAIKGTRSPICAVFNDAEWMAYEYAWDLKYAHMVGPLNPLSPYLGFPWLQAQTKLFSAIDSHDKAKEEDHDNKGPGWPKGQRLFLSFTHREVPPFVATALGIFNSSSTAKEEFPTDRINWTRAWKMSDLIPFLGHVGLEKLTCDASSGREGEFIRVIANSAPRPIPNCQKGPSASCPFEDFKEIMRAGDDKYGDFHAVCGTKSRH
ncbi:histidine acid phosphatase-like protein [Melanomma pulvis-pyrius CBS 109.77]|uniref:Histidine acid phosphatase-like protein n=1 Tax=Melanomma pulvis-pyrius CBS 109.77 TaxID=1314802 RepID=A0A6A6XN80_9PLEO|nr:histidine acid phosphatase-like protein [Melanomma pulvis-pyrius CBS 109.77]